MDGIEQWVGDVHIKAPTATFWPEQDVPPDIHKGTKPSVFMHLGRREHVVVPELAMHGITEVVSMTKTTERSPLELNKTDRQNTTRERANIFVDKDVEDRKNMSWYGK